MLSSLFTPFVAQASGVGGKGEIRHGIVKRHICEGDSVFTSFSRFSSFCCSDFQEGWMILRRWLLKTGNSSRIFVNIYFCTFFRKGETTYPVAFVFAAAIA